MIKYFCDICGKNVVHAYNLNQLFIKANMCTDYNISKDICDECKAKLLEYINLTSKEESKERDCDEK